MPVGTSIAARRYAAALLDLAAQSNAIPAVEKDLGELAAMLRNSPDLQGFSGNPLIARQAQTKAMTALAEKAGFHALTRNFLGTLAQNRRLPMLAGVLAAFQDELMRRRGEVRAKVQVAAPLSDKQAKALQERLSKETGAKVGLDVTVNRDLLGGMVVTVGSKMIDDSIKNKLQRLRREMSAGRAA